MSWPRFRMVTARGLLQEGRLTLLDGSGVRSDPARRGAWAWVDGSGRVVRTGLHLDRAVGFYVASLAVMAATNSTRNG